MNICDTSFKQEHVLSLDIWFGFGKQDQTTQQLGEKEERSIGSSCSSLHWEAQNQLIIKTRLSPALPVDLVRKHTLRNYIDCNKGKLKEKAMKETAKKKVLYANEFPPAALTGLQWNLQDQYLCTPVASAEKPAYNII